MRCRPWEDQGGHNLHPAHQGRPNDIHKLATSASSSACYLHKPSSLPTPASQPNLPTSSSRAHLPDTHLCSSSSSTSYPSHQPASLHPDAFPACSLPCWRDRAPDPPAASVLQLPRRPKEGGEGRGGGYRPELQTRCSELDCLRTICHHLNLKARQSPIVMLIQG